MDDNEDDKAKMSYMPYIEFIIEKTKANGIVLIIIGGDHGSASMVAVKNDEALQFVPIALRELLENMEPEAVKPLKH